LKLENRKSKIANQKSQIKNLSFIQGQAASTWVLTFGAGFSKNFSHRRDAEIAEVSSVFPFR